MAGFDNKTINADRLIVPTFYVTLAAATNTLDGAGKTSITITNTTLLGLNIGGITGGVDDQLLWIYNQSNNVLSTLNLLNGAGAASPENRIFPAGLVNLSLGINNGRMFQYRSRNGMLGWYQIL